MKQEKTDNKIKGDEGEILASKYLVEHGYQIIHTKWKHGRFELDIIATKDNFLVFVEVKTRYSNEYGEPWEAVNKAKRKKICLSGDAYIQQYDTEMEPRFDIISIVHANNRTEILHIEEAFWPVL